MSTRRPLRVAGPGLLGGLVLASVAAWLMQRGETPAPAEPSRSEAPSAPVAAKPSDEHASDQAPLAADDVITGVAIDREKVCVGSEALVEVQLAPAFANAGVTVAGAFANPAIVRAHRLGSRRVPVAVFRGGARVAETELAIEGVDCGREPRLVVAARRRGPGRVEGMVVIARGLDDGPRRWDFGDGTIIDTLERTVVHDYSPPDRPTTHVVSVTAVTEPGAPIVARAHFTVLPSANMDDPAWAETASMLAERNREQAALRAEEGRAPDPIGRRAP